MIHLMNLVNEPFNSIKNGEKIIEMRLYDEKRRKISINDNILFSCGNESILTIVTDLFVFKDFNELYNSFDKTTLGYKENSVYSYKDMHEFYSEEDIKKYGVIAIKIKVVK